MSGRRHGAKGDRIDWQVVDAHGALGLEARRRPLSGVLGRALRGTW